jgi:TolB protein
MELPRPKILWTIVVAIAVIAVAILLMRTDREHTSQVIAPPIQSQVVTSTTPVATTNPNSPTENSKVFSDPNYTITFNYPADWQRNDGYYQPYYKGITGYFSVDSIDGAGQTIDYVTNNVVEATARVQGVKVAVKKIIVQGYDARLLSYEATQGPPSQLGLQEILIVKYPHPITLATGVYYFLELSTDANHMNQIASSIRFLK